jgi:hypothetical protein
MLTGTRALLPAFLLLAACGGRSAVPEDSGLPCTPAGAGEAWSRTLGITDGDWSLDRQPSLAVTADGDIVVATAFVGTLDFGCQVLRSRGARDVLLARLDPRGRLRWAKQLVGDANRSHHAEVAVDGAGRITLAVAAEQGSVEVEGTSVEGPLVLASFEADGTLRWAERALVTPDEPTDWMLAGSPGGRIALGGSYTLAQTLDFGSGRLPGAPVESTSAFLAVWDAEGTLLGASVPGGLGDARLASLLLADDGTAILTGATGVSAFYGGPHGLFLSRVDDTGTALWSRTDAALGPITSDSDGFLVASGDHFDPADPAHGITVTRRALADGAPSWTTLVPVAAQPGTTLESVSPAGIAGTTDGRVVVAANILGRDENSAMSERAVLLATLDGATPTLRRFEGDDGLTAFALAPTGHPVVAGFAWTTFALGEAGVVGGHSHWPDSFDLYLARLAP